jgi:hypothetical protein
MVLRTLLFKNGIIKFDEVEKRIWIFETAYDHVLTFDTWSDAIASCKRK